MELETHIQAVRRQGELLFASAVDLDAEVPTCPGWTVRDLVRHQGEVHRWARSHVAEARQTLNTADFRTFPEEDQRLLIWYREGLAQLVKTLEDADPGLDCYSFLPGGPRGTRFWARRQAHETTIHRVDVQSVRGEITPTTPEFAADGIDELLRGFYARRPSRLATDEPYSFAVRPDDIDRTWVVHVGADGASTSDSGHAETDLRGSAFELYLLLWNRRPLPDTLVHWREKARVQWSG